MKSIKSFESNALTAPNQVMGGAPNVGDPNDWDLNNVEPVSGVFPAYHWPAGTWPGDHPGGLPASYSGDVLSNDL